MSISTPAVSTHPISAQFVDVAGRRVLLRFAGSGPAVLLLHQSPQNSRALITWIERLSAHYSVFAPDTPGFGYSDPLPLAQPTIPDYAAALNGLLDALGIERVIVNGVHTGAVTALRFALDFPARVAGLICDGYARFNAEERQLLLNGYLPPFEPQWDGSHLLWLWARLREQHLFFPWNTATKTARMAYPAPSTERLSGDVLDILDAGDGYRAGYRAPFLYDDATAASRLTVETRIFYRAEDVLATHLPRLQGLPTNVAAEIVNGGPAALIERTDAFIASHAANASRLDAGAAVLGAVSTRRRVYGTTHGSMCTLIAANGGDLANSLVVVHLNEIGTPARIPVEVPHGTPVIAPELPGHGASQAWSAANLTLGAVAQSVLQILQALGVRRYCVSSEGAAGAIAAALVRVSVENNAGPRCEQLRLHNPMLLNEAERAQFVSQLPDLTPNATGAHLLAAWNWARMKALFWPWQQPTVAAVRRVDAPAPVRLHAEVVEILRVGALFAPLWRAALADQVYSALAEYDGRITIQCDDEPERVRIVDALANTLGLVEATLSASEQSTGVKTWRKL
ncbi:MAG: alpha/beta fold hydrolase [Rhodocyclaceae bacterium]|nr:alpha/beta fold hydrolase [Rhodocyclaceae bacterium]